MSVVERQVPPDFKEWISPWVLDVVWMFGPDGETSARIWSRMYREQSHCGKDGCCELTYPLMGPQVGPTLLVDGPDV